ncbi:MAG: hypothetical protein PHZ07_04885 [Patescibacteria group bacterium]|nr:hypothetical protein [Patescibacteria group bacterium]MDD4304717.1 hypothetical protein [Patescibacteria group bacterium]MDD4695721.1 hypothetical protein [Patescibacteria group bacterium]
MPFYATHIKFAIDIKDKYQIKDLSQYISGSIYPDSHYITKIDKKLTHNENVLSSDFANTDFKCGWQAHFICDLIQEEISKYILPEICFEANDEKSYTGIASIKIVQDMFDVKNFDLNHYLSFLDHVENPNKENINKIIEYNKLIKNTYLNKSECEINDYRRIIEAFSLERNLIEETLKKAQELLNDFEKLEKVKLIYNLMLKYYNK